MGPIASLWTRNRPHRVQVVFALRVTIGALAALGIAQYFNLRLPLWAVLTAIIVTQISVGRSLKATIDYLCGTVAGVACGGALAILVPHDGEAALLGVLGAAVGPLALLGVIDRRMAVAPITAAIVILVPSITHTSPLASALDRVLEVGLGAVCGFVVSFLVLPSNAHRLAITTIVRTLDQMAEAFGGLLEGLGRGLNADDLHRIQDHIGRAMTQLAAIGEEAERERSARLSAGPDTRPLLRTLLRLRHDMVMIGRVAGAPLPETLMVRLCAPLARIRSAAADYLRGCGEALLAHRGAPSLEGVDAALAGFTAEVAALNEDGLTAGLSVAGAERFFALSFALQQARQNFGDLGERVAEWAEASKRPGRAVTDPPG